MTAGYRCIRCHRGNDEPAGEECKHPSWHVAVMVESAQPGACWRCKCANPDVDACGCCHVSPCEMER